MKPTRTRSNAGPPTKATLAVGAFVHLVEADGLGDFRRASEAQERLSRLGWTVTRRKSRRGGRGVAHA